MLSKNRTSCSHCDYYIVGVALIITLPPYATEYWKADGRINSGDDQATRDIILVSFDRYLQSLRESAVYNSRRSALGLVYLRLLGGNTVMFRCYSLGADTSTPSWLYARLCHAFLVIITGCNDT